MSLSFMPTNFGCIAFGCMGMVVFKKRLLAFGFHSA
jgi:hypothetical protein